MKEKFDLFDVNKRILLIMKEKGFNKNSLSKQIGLSQPALKKIEANENLPSFKLLFGLLALFPEINSDWLISGHGEMLKSSESAEGQQEEGYKSKYLELIEKYAALQEKYAAVLERKVEVAI